MVALTSAAKNSHKGEGAAYFEAVAYLNALATKLGIAFEYKPIDVVPDSPVVKPFEPSRAAFVCILLSKKPFYQNTG